MRVNVMRCRRARSASAGEALVDSAYSRRKVCAAPLSSTAIEPEKGKMSPGRNRSVSLGMAPVAPLSTALPSRSEPRVAPAVTSRRRANRKLLPPALARAAQVYPLGGADPVTARKWLARAAVRPAKLVLYANSSGSIGVVIAQVFAFNLKQIGIDVEVRYFDTLTLIAKAETPGEPFDVIMLGWSADYADGAAFFVPLLGNGGRAVGGIAHERPALQVAAVDDLQQRPPHPGQDMHVLVPVDVVGGEAHAGLEAVELAIDLDGDLLRI